MRVLFPPPPRPEQTPRTCWQNKGRQRTSYLTINGRIAVERSIYWHPDVGTKAPVDGFLGITSDRISPGTRELCCREAASGSFRTAAEDLQRVGQIPISHEMLRQVVEAQGRLATRQQQSGQIDPGWTADDCVTGPNELTCLITGADGVKVPLVTELEKAKRRLLRKKRGPQARRRRQKIAKGADQPYKEFKIVAFYDPTHEHQYALGTSGNHEALGKLMRREAGKLKLGDARQKYSVTDGADWIRRQYQVQLPMLDANVLDYYHLREHVIAAAKQVFGEATPEAQRWREEMMGVAIEQGPVRLLECIGELRKATRSPGKRAALEGLQNYIAPRSGMLDYPQFKSRGYQIGSGPTEAFCKTLTARLKGCGRRWDQPNAQALMTLASIRTSGLWKPYWAKNRIAAA